MKKFMNWPSTVFTPKMNEICSEPWIAAVSSSMQKIIPFILTGSVICFYNVSRSYLPVLPDLGMIADYSFGLISLILVFVVGQQRMERLNHPFYLTNCGIAPMAVFMMLIIPGIDEAGNMVIQGGRLGVVSIAVGIVAGLLTSIILNLYSKLHVLEDPTSIPDFAVGWINYILSTLITLGLGMVLTKYCNFDIFEIVSWIFSPPADFAQTMPGFVFCYLIPAVLYNMGISPWLFGAATTLIFLVGIQENINMVVQGLPATNIATGETVFMAAPVTIGNMGATFALNVLMCFSKLRQLKTLGRIFIRPSILNINEPIVLGMPVVFNPLLVLPMWLNSIAGLAIAYIVMSLRWLSIPVTLSQAGQVPIPTSTVMITQDMRGILWAAVLFVVYFAAWYPFFKVFEKQKLVEEAQENAPSQD